MIFMKKILKRIIIKLKFRKKVQIGSGCNITLNSHFDGFNYIGENVCFDGKLGIGSYIGNDCSISASIGKFTCIAPNVKTINGFHPTKKMISIHPAFFSTENCTGLGFGNRKLFDEQRYADKNSKNDIIVGNDVWIGYGVTIIAGVTIHDGAIIGSGAVVTKDVLPYSIVGGNPAKEIRKRFTDEQINTLEEIKWWDNSIDWIKSHAGYFCNIDQYLDILAKDSEEK